jgi:peptide/nickel transport system substrate-binding protein
MRQHRNYSKAWRVIAALAVVTAASCGSDDDAQPSAVTEHASADTVGSTAGSSPADTSAAPEPSGTDAAAPSDLSVDIVLTGEPTALEACDSPLSGVGTVLRSNVTQALTVINPDTGVVEPQLATEWDQVDDSTWTFTLREGVTFQDGEPFDAAAVAFGIDRAMNPDLACTVASDQFSGQEVTVTAIDDLTVEIATSTPSPILPKALSFMDFPSPKTPLDAKQPTAVGTGPYTIAEQSPDGIVLERWEDYWGDLPAVQTANYSWLTEASARSALAKTSDASIVYGMLPQDAGVDGVVQYTTTDTLQYRMSTNIAPLDDIRLREAINLAIDREGIIASAMGGLGEPASQITGPYNEGYNDTIPLYEFDPDRAKALVDDARAAGVAVDTPITIYERAGHFPGIAAVDQAMQAQLAAIGLTVEIEVVDPEVAIDISLSPRNVDRPPNLAENVHGNASGDAWNTLSTKYLSTGRSSTLDEGTPLDIAIQSGGVASGDERKALFQDAFALVREVFPDVPMFHMSGLIYINPSISYQPNPNTANLLDLSTIVAS